MEEDTNVTNAENGTKERRTFCGVKCVSDVHRIVDAEADDDNDAHAHEGVDGQPPKVQNACEGPRRVSLYLAHGIDEEAKWDRIIVSKPSLEHNW